MYVNNNDLHDLKIEIAKFKKQHIGLCIIWGFMSVFQCSFISSVGSFSLLWSIQVFLTALYSLLSFDHYRKYLAGCDISKDIDRELLKFHK